MRWLALLSALLCTLSLVLAFLCLFAGSSRGFLQDYAVVTLNTSRLGQDIFNTSETSSNPLVSWYYNVTNEIESEIQEEFGSFAKDLGLHDFYSAHLMTYCEGYYTPGPVPNATLSASDIHENVTLCSNRTTAFDFDPREILQRELNRTGHSNINLTVLHWPQAIDDGIKAVETLAKATFVLYCVAIGLIGLSVILAFVSVFFNGSVSALINIILELLAFAIILVASAIVTTVATKVTDTVNKYGNDVGVSASHSTGFLALTWTATAAMLVASIVWCFSCFSGRRSSKMGKGSSKAWN